MWEYTEELAAFILVDQNPNSMCCPVFSIVGLNVIFDCGVVDVVVELPSLIDAVENANSSLLITKSERSWTVNVVAPSLLY